MTELPPPLAVVVVVVTPVPPAPPALVVASPVVDEVPPWQPAHTASIPVNALMPRNINLPLRTMRTSRNAEEERPTTPRWAQPAPCAVEPRDGASYHGSRSVAAPIWGNVGEEVGTVAGAWRPRGEGGAPPTRRYEDTE